MRDVITRNGSKKHEPYPLNEFTNTIIESICKRIVHSKAVGKADISGDEFSHFFADSISGQSLDKPVGIADVVWNGCCWSVKTVKQKNPHKVTSIRLISGRNSPAYSSGINDPYTNVKDTGQSVLDIYNQRIDTATSKYKDIRLVVLIRNMEKQEFTLF